MGTFDGKVVLVTGASSGMGRATAVELGRQGAKVICAARRADKGQATLDDIRAAGGEGHFVRADIGDKASIDALFGFIADKYGRLDGAFNNAGIEVETGNLADISLDAFDEVMNVNVRGTFICLQHELRMMRARKSGAVVNTSSLGGTMGLKGCSAYVGSKHAIVGITKSAALDMAAFGVRVNVICPGTVDTEMMRRWTQGSDEAFQHLVDYSPMKRVGMPREIADTVLWLLSNASSYVTGLVMEVDGGVSAGLGM